MDIHGLNHLLKRIGHQAMYNNDDYDFVYVI